MSSFYTTAFPPVAAIPLCTGISKTSALFCGVKVLSVFLQTRYTLIIITAQLLTFILSL